MIQRKRRQVSDPALMSYHDGATVSSALGPDLPAAKTAVQSLVATHSVLRAPPDPSLRLSRSCGRRPERGSFA